MKAPYVRPVDKAALKSGVVDIIAAAPEGTLEVDGATVLRSVRILVFCAPKFRSGWASQNRTFSGDVRIGDSGICRPERAVGICRVPRTSSRSRCRMHEVPRSEPSGTVRLQGRMLRLPSAGQVYECSSAAHGRDAQRVRLVPQRSWLDDESSPCCGERGRLQTVPQLMPRRRVRLDVVLGFVVPFRARAGAGVYECWLSCSLGVARHGRTIDEGRTAIGAGCLRWSDYLGRNGRMPATCSLLWVDCGGTRFLRHRPS